MRISAKKILLVMLPMAVFLISSPALSYGQTQVDQTSDAKQELSALAPGLAEIIPLAAELSGRLAALEFQLTGLLDVSAVERKYAGIEANLKGTAGQLQRLKDAKAYRFSKIVGLRETIEQKKEMFDEISEPLSNAISQLEAWRKEWLEEKKRWNQWQSSLLDKGLLDQVKSTFSKANGTIDTALNLVLPQLEAMLRVQARAGNIQAKLDVLVAKLDGLILLKRHGVLLEKLPPMFSSRYFSQFGRELWYSVLKGLDEILWPGSWFFDRLGWILLLQGFISLFTTIAIYRKRQVLNDYKRWRFLAARPFSAGLFLGFMTTMAIYFYVLVPETWALVVTIVGGISFARLSGNLIEAAWKRQFVYGLIFVIIVTKIIDVVSLPLPLFRLYTVLTALVGLFFFLRWAGESRRHKDSSLYTWSLRLVSLFLVVIIIAELWGKAGLAEHLFVSLMRSIATVLIFILFSHMIRGGLEWLFRTSLLRRVTVQRSATDAIIRRATLFIDVAIWGLVVLPAILVIWGVFDTLEEAMKCLLALGVNLGSQRISIGLVIASAGILYGSLLTSWILQKLLMDSLLVKRQLEMGVRHSIVRLVHYVIIFAGFLLALSTLGFDLTKLTIILSALGIGIGFGLQGIVNDFVSGLILLFERPVRVGDNIELDGKWSEIKSIGLRSTIVQTVDQADLIIPNSDLVNNKMTNWTLSNRRVRLTIPVGVAYGSDVPLVVETLMACGKANSNLVKTLEPQVLFQSFGDSSLDFELRVWVLDADNRLLVKSELHQEIDRRFREANIEIAFPQRELHLRSIDESVILPPQKPTR
jgi:potassium efflux system protein